MPFHPTQLGFRVHYFRDLANAGTADLRTIKMTDEIPFDVQTQCPACRIDLIVFCTLVASDDYKRIRIGACETCGYLGYIDRPSKDWMVRYYEEDWDNARMRDVKKDAAELKHALSKEQQDLVNLAVGTGVRRTRAVCDIGCGNGGILKGMADVGFTNLIGVENSRYRAELAREKYGYNVFVGNFENQDVQKSLAAEAPMGIFLSFHVMEHVYHPREIIASCATQQQEGDHLIFAMPDTLYEPAIITLFWLPHLHSYTRATLERLFNAYGYAVVADNFLHRRLMMAAKKVNPVRELARGITPRARIEHADPAVSHGAFSNGVKNPKPRYISQFDRNATAARLMDWFFLQQMEESKRYAVSWTSKKYQTGVAPVSVYRSFDRLLQRGEQAYDFLATRLFNSFRNYRSIVISPLEKRITDPKESYLEIQYDGDIELLVR